MDKRKVLFNCLRLNTIDCLKSLLAPNGKYTVTDIKELVKGTHDISDEELGSVQTVTELWDMFIRKGVINMDYVAILKIIAEGLKCDELKKEIEDYEWKITGKVWKVLAGVAEKAELALKIGLPIGIEGIGMALLHYYGEDETTNKLLLEKIILPPFVKLAKVREGSVRFVVETRSLSSLRQLWTSYKDGSLREKLKKVINEIQEVRELTDGTEIDVTVEIDEIEYRKACWLLVSSQIFEQAHSPQTSSEGTRRRRRNSFSCEQDLTLGEKTHLTWKEWIKMKEIENIAVYETKKRREDEKQIVDLKQELRNIEDQAKVLEEKNDKLRETLKTLKNKKVNEEKQLKAKINQLKAKIGQQGAELKLLQNVNEELIRQCFQVQSLRKSLEILKILKDTCLDFESSYQSLSKDIKAMKQGDKQAQKVVFQSIDKYYMAMKCFEKCFNIVLEQSDSVEHMKAALEIGDKKEEGNAYQKLADISYALLQYEEAIEYYERFLEVAVDDEDEMRAYRYLGEISLYLENYYKGEAIKNYRKYLEAAKNTNDKKGVADAYDGLGDTYQAVGMNNDAIKCYETCSKITDVKEIKANVYGKIGNIYLSLEKREEADNYLERREIILQQLLNDK